MFSRLAFPPLCSPDAPSAAEPAAPARPAVPPVTPERRAQSLTDRLIHRHGDANAALAFAASNNIILEDQVTNLTRENEEFSRRLPEGAVVITAAEAKNLAKLKELGVEYIDE